MRFNGATLFQAWKRGLVAERVPSGSKPASMGPRSFKRGNKIARQTTWGGGRGLQWGHALSSVETRLAAATAGRAYRRFNGATLFQAWKPDPHLLPFMLHPLASMGPRSFKRGNKRYALKYAQKHEQLQWGHALSSVETARRPARASRPAWGFNGATLFQAWKHQRTCSRSSSLKALQWGHALSSVETLKPQARLCHFLRLQWGHALSSVETVQRVALIDFLD